MLRPGHAFNVNGVLEVTEILVGFADAVVLGIVAVLYVGHAPSLVADKLEGARTLTVFLSFEAHVVVGHGLAPSTGQMVAGSGEDARHR